MRKAFGTLAILACAVTLGGCPWDDPTTRADCMEGGWDYYGFDNQGHCIRYVETGKDKRPWFEIF
jgi:hypothetical protein